MISDTYLYIISQFCPCLWKYELFLLEIEDHMKTVLIGGLKTKTRQFLYKIGDQLFSMMRDSFLVSRPPTQGRLMEILQFLAEDLALSSQDLDRLSKRSFSYWKFVLRPKYWESLLKLHESRAGLKNEKKVVTMLMEIEDKKGRSVAEVAWQKALKSDDVIQALQNVLLGKTHQGEPDQMLRPPEEIKRLMLNANKSRNTLGLDKILDDDVLNFNGLWLEEAKDWIKMVKEKPPQKLDYNDFLMAFNSVVHSHFQFYLTRPQKITILTILKCTSKNPNILGQISTGEGKSLTVAAIAIARALSGITVDVITSSLVLAIRDSSKSVKQGGLLEIFEEFGVSVAHNCDPEDENRKVAYSAKVVYGELATFQKDFLLYTFYGKNLLGQRRQCCVIIDEVDCMLLDRGTNMLYLAHVIPGLETLEALFVHIWLRVNMPDFNHDLVKAEIQFILMGKIGREDLVKIDWSLSQQNPTERDQFWDNLIKHQIIDAKGKLISKTISQESLGFIEDQGIKMRAVKFFKSVANRERSIPIPSHLHSFVELHLDSFLENAIVAKNLHHDVHYVVDVDRNQQSLDLNPLVTIIDRDTGTDQTTSQWDGGLHQFLQLKEGCKITPLVLKAVFVSNITFIKNYDLVNGVTGTLGSEPERDFLKEMFNTNFLIIPTAYRKHMSIDQPTKLSQQEEWLNEIVNNVSNAIKTRSVIVFTKSIRDAKLISKTISNKCRIKEGDKLHTYIRDYEDFEFESKELEPGHVIVATNLAGRGTDIKLSPKVKANGGLHICLTYLPDNYRIEEQAFGRAGTVLYV